MCILGEPTENKLVLAHFGSLWLRLSTRGPFIHTAFSEGRQDENSILRMRRVLDAVLEWLPAWEERVSVRRRARGRQCRVDRGRVRLASLADAAPHRSVPRRARPAERDDAGRARKALDFARSLEGVDAEVYVTAPGAEIAGRPPAGRGRRGSAREVFGAEPERDVTRWFSDASVLTRYGIETLNYGTSSGLPSAELGENLDIDGLVQTAEVYARAAMRICGT